MIFPVRWHEPFGLAIVESLYFGCPVFGTPYGSLPEIVAPDVGVLSARASDLAEAVRGAGGSPLAAEHFDLFQHFNGHADASRGVGFVVDELGISEKDDDRIADELVDSAAVDRRDR